MEDHKAVRENLLNALLGFVAHIPFSKAIEGFPYEKAGEQIPLVEHTGWMLVWHIHKCMEDIISYAESPQTYKEIPYPKGYWPQSVKPESRKDWEQTINRTEACLNKVEGWIKDYSKDLFAPIPGTPGHSLFREILLIIDHNSYHIAQLIDLRMSLGIPVKDW